MYSISDNGNPAPDEWVTQTGETQEADFAQVGEIEVTEEMIEAAACEIVDYNPGFVSASEIAVRALAAALGRSER